MNGLELRQDGEYVSFAVRVTPRASRDALLDVRDGVLRVALSAPPVDGAANSALIKLLSKLLGVSKSHVQISRGQRGRDKLVRVHGLSPEDVRLDLLLS